MWAVVRVPVEQAGLALFVRKKEMCEVCIGDLEPAGLLR